MVITYPKWGAERFHDKNENALIYGFKVGSDKLADEHKAGIKVYADFILSKTIKYSITIVVKGNCSRSGSAAVNLILSINRAAAVANYLRSLLPASVVIVPFGFGESAADLDGWDDGSESDRHRSVLMIGVAYKKGSFPPLRQNLIQMIPRIWKSPKPTGQFTVQMLAGKEGGGGIGAFGLSLGATIARFKLCFRDISRGIYANAYLYTAAYKLDWGAPFSVEALTIGPQQSFYLHPEFRVEDFEGFVDLEGMNLDFGKPITGFGRLSSWRFLDTPGISSPLIFNIPPGAQSWEFGKFGIGISKGKGYVSLLSYGESWA